MHKILTGRRDGFANLRKYGGLSGFPKPYESVHDAFIAGHASNSISVAIGMARARTLKEEDYSVLAFIGDGALTGGLAYEGLSDAGDSGEPLIIILNDNGMSITPNVGGMASYLSKKRLKPSYKSFKQRYRRIMHKIPGGTAVYNFTPVSYTHLDVYKRQSPSFMQRRGIIMLRETCRAPFVQGDQSDAGKPPLSKGRCHSFSCDGGIVVQCCRYTHKHHRNSDLLRCLVFLLPIDRIGLKNLSWRHHIQALFSQNAVTRQALPQFLPPHSKSLSLIHI